MQLLRLARKAGLAHMPKGVVFAVGLVCCVIVVCALVRFWPAGTQAVDTFEASGSIDAGQQEGAGGEDAARVEAGSSDVGGSSTAITVDVEGAVKAPGVYEFAANARVSDAIEAAGGLTRSAHAASVNRARVLEDGEQIYVPTKKEASGSSAVGGSGTSSSGAASAAGQAKVNINQATLEELQTLNGIGPVLAQSIIDYREQQGSFTSVEDLKNVSGIGDVRFENLKDSVCV